MQKIRLRLINLRHPADRDADPGELVSQILQIDRSCISDLTVLRRATDARQERVDFVYTVAFSLIADTETLERLLARTDIAQQSEPQQLIFSGISGLKERPIIIGSGPAGLFAALTLVERGMPPIVIERGERIAARAETVELFWRQGFLNPESNVLYGEGGAGTFSDGKLTTRTKSPLKQKVFETFIALGADPAIAYDSKPHIGTDRLQKIIPALVDDLQRRGADFLFETRVSDILIEQQRVTGLTAGGRHFPAETVFLAAGHSARELYRLLQHRGVLLEPKGFAVGVRIEHPQEFIDRALLGPWVLHPALGPADYFFSHKDAESGRGVYSFCMCPGGYIIGCATRDGQLCTNGMSSLSRNSGRANAAIVVSLRADDFPGGGTLGGLDFQDQLEKAAFTAGGGGFFAPAQTAAGFVSGRPDEALGSSCSYNPGIRHCDLRTLLPDCITGPLRRGLQAFDRKLYGFIGEGMLVGIETRTSSPVRVVRDGETFHARGARGLIPVGEGSGYAGGIISSAVDGMQGALHFDS